MLSEPYIFGSFSWTWYLMGSLVQVEYKIELTGAKGQNDDVKTTFSFHTIQKESDLDIK